MKKRRPNIWLSLFPLLLLITLLAVCVHIFGDSMLEGASQLTLICVTLVICLIAILIYGYSWRELEQAMVHNNANAMGANLILLMVGTLGGTWMHSGIIPTMICYGIDLISPQWFLLTACLISALVSVCTGSSWTTIATIGVGLLGIGRAVGIEDGWIAGAIISGAYFGDKISPLSETTNLASSTADVPLFTHIRYMLHTTTPSFLVALCVFAVAGFVGNDVAQGGSSLAMQSHLQSFYHIHPALLLVPVGVIVMIWRGVPPLFVLFFGALTGALLLPLCQPDVVPLISQRGDGLACVEAAMRCAFGGVSYATGFEAADALTSTSGMAGMLNTIWLIICAMCFGGAMEGSGMLNVITERMLLFMKGRFRTVAATCLSSMFVNVAAGDQYLSIILPGRMYHMAYRRQGLEARLLSRSLEDAGTVTSVLVPWNSCGMTQSSILGVATLVYAPYCVFCWISPLMSMAFALFRKTKPQSPTPNC